MNAIQYIQGTLAVVNPHRISAGVGVRDVLPGIDLDLMGGGMFEASEQLGALTATSLESYWAGAGITWRFGRGSCRRLPARTSGNSAATGPPHSPSEVLRIGR